MSSNNGSRHSRRGGPRPGGACPELVEGAPAPAPRAKPSWGGKREGAGAPKGNLNALKHGVNSHQLQQLALALSLVPEARKALVRLVRRQRRQQAQARTVAVTLLTNLLRASLQSLGNNQPVSGTVALIPNSDRPIRSSNSRNINQTTQSRPQSQSNPALPSPSKGEGQGEGTN